MKMGMLALTAVWCLVTMPLQAEVVYETSFEGSQGYTLGDVVGQNGWGTVSGDYSTVHDVIADEETLPPVPDGARMLQVTTSPTGKESYAVKKWSATAYSDFYASVDMAFSVTGGPPADGTNLGYVLLYGSDAGSGMWKGIRFGFGYVNGQYVVRCRHGGNTYTVCSGVLPETFYRFTLHAYVETGGTTRYSLQVYRRDGTLLGERPLNTSQWEMYDTLAVSVTPPDANGYDGASLYVDQLAIASMDGVQWLPGDANGDHRVSFEDFSILQNHYGQSGVGRAAGDFDGDGRVTFADFSILQNHYGQSLGGPAAAERSAAAAPCGLLGEALLMCIGLGILGYGRE